MRMPVLLALSGCLLLASCHHAAPATKPSTMPIGEVMEHVPVVLQLVARPAEIHANNPSDEPAEPKNIRLTLIVRNVTERTFRGDSPDAAIAKFALTIDGEPLWSYPTMAAQVVTPVTLAPHQSATYEVIATLPDVRVYKGKTLVAHASFSPTATQEQTEIVIK